MAASHSDTAEPADGAARSDAPIRVLDAGCGRNGQYTEFGANAYIVGIDADEAALRLNEAVNERILGDIQTYPLEASSFDEVLCRDVLEHLPRPDLALANLSNALKPGGRLSLAFPNVLSFKGLVTKFTPLRVHKWVYRHVYLSKTVGKPGYPPYRTYLRWTMSPTAIRRFAAHNNLVVEEARLFEAPLHARFWKQHRLLCRLLDWLWPVGDPHQSECEFFLRKLSAMDEY